MSFLFFYIGAEAESDGAYTPRVVSAIYAPTSLGISDQNQFGLLLGGWRWDGEG